MFLVVCFDRMTVSRFWGRLSCVSTVVSPWWTVRNRFPRNLFPIEVGTIPWMLTRDQGYLCATRMCQFTIHLLNNTKTQYFHKLKLNNTLWWGFFFIQMHWNSDCDLNKTYLWLKCSFYVLQTRTHTPLSLCALLELYPLLTLTSR